MTETPENEVFDGLARRRRRKNWGILVYLEVDLLRIPPLVYDRSTIRGGILNINTTDHRMYVSLFAKRVQN